MGTFVGDEVDDYLVIASDAVRSGEARLPASTFKIPNSLIAGRMKLTQQCLTDIGAI